MYGPMILHIKEIMCVIREKDGERAAGIFNFSWEDFSGFCLSR